MPRVFPARQAMDSRYRSSPCFVTAFGPYLPGIADQLDYDRVQCPNSDRLCKEQSLWLEQAMFLGPREDIDDIYRAFEKVYEQRGSSGLEAP